MRFIPAWAGNADVSGSAGRFDSVHPRVGGERPERTVSPVAWIGSSPRGRGTHSKAKSLTTRYRFIPAWAGNASRPRPRAADPAVHPRVGGERARALVQRLPVVGSSPRGRGTHNRPLREVALRRFIPAWAGNARATISTGGACPVHPRVGGERRSTRALNRSKPGSSPRGRGTHAPRPRRRHRRRFIPAWAGNAGRPSMRLLAVPVHPRVGGERPQETEGSGVGDGSSPRGRGTPDTPTPPSGSSPRGRGTLATRSPSTPNPRFIPAWAGNAAQRRAPRPRRSVHPRVGGERSRSQSQTNYFAGSSPRGRGTRLAMPAADVPTRFIPAWAGNAGSSWT